MILQILQSDSRRQMIPFLDPRLHLADAALEPLFGDFAPSRQTQEEQAAPPSSDVAQGFRSEREALPDRFDAVEARAAAGLEIWK